LTGTYRKFSRLTTLTTKNPSWTTPKSTWIRLNWRPSNVAETMGGIFTKKTPFPCTAVTGPRCCHLCPDMRICTNRHRRHLGTKDRPRRHRLRNRSCCKVVYIFLSSFALGLVAEKVFWTFGIFYPSLYSFWNICACVYRNIDWFRLIIFSYGHLFLFGNFNDKNWTRE